MDLERFIGKYLSLLVLSYNPNQYEKLIHGKLRDFVKFFLRTLFVGFVIFTVATLAISVNYVSDLPRKLDKVEQFEIGGVIATNDSVMIISDPDIVLDLEYNGTSNSHEIVLSKDGITYPKYIFFGKTFVPWTALSDFKQQTAERDNLLYGAILFLLPSLLFWFFIFTMVKLALFSLVLLLGGYYIPRMFKSRIPATCVAKLLLLTAPSVIIIGVGLHPLGSELFWWGAALSTVFFVIGVSLLSERVIRSSKRFSKASKSKV